MTRLIERRPLGEKCPTCGKDLFQRYQETGEKAGLLQGKWLPLGKISCDSGHRFEMTTNGLTPVE